MKSVEYGVMVNSNIVLYMGNLKKARERLYTPASIIILKGGQAG